VAKYFISSLFGTEELTNAEFLHDGREPAEPTIEIDHPWEDDDGAVETNCVGAYDPYFDQKCTPYTFIEEQMSSLITPHLESLSKGAWLLYEASLKKGSAGAKVSSKGAQMIEGVKVQLMASLHLMTQDVWKDALEVLNAAKESYGSAEDIEAAMKPYEEFKPADQPLTYEQASLRYQKSVAMMKDVAKTENGEDKFQDEICTKKTIEEGKTEFNEYEIAEYECGYGVNGGVQRLETIIDPSGGFINPFE
jgi:hypothetical protein